MSNSFKTIFFCFLFSCTVFFSEKSRAQEVAVNFQVFYNELAPYGTWVNSPVYGYVWLPTVDEGFQPYATNGYWLLTQEGWTWVSNYPWGWAPFHYGRWYNDEIYGAMWVPDNEWGPGWVNWRQNDDYYGWCAISPIGGSFVARNEDWTFVHSNHFGHRNWHEHMVNRNGNITIINNTIIINNTRSDGFHHVKYNGGPDRMQVEHTTGEKLMPIAIIDDSKHEATMNNNELHLYRPSVEKNNTIGVKPAPTKVLEMKDVKLNEKRRSEFAQPKTNEIKHTATDAANRDVTPLKKQSTIPISKPLLQKNKPMQIDAPMHQFPQQSKPIQPINKPRNNSSEKQVPQAQQPLPSNGERQHNNSQPHQQTTPINKNNSLQKKGSNEHRPH
ncbi:MAG: hypothetical protein RL708_153 [Bacteroidota bacterium]|jgi:hypothetical protein